jgi:hypothetical protein
VENQAVVLQVPHQQRHKTLNFCLGYLHVHFLHQLK